MVVRAVSIHSLPNVHRMAAVFYYILRPLLFLVSLLPLKVLYVLSDILYFFMYRVARYRLKVIRENLQDSFPGKSPDEIRVIYRAFYRNLCDVIVEVVKVMTISPATIRQMFAFDSVLLRRYAAQNRSVIILMAHLGNWELTGMRIGLEREHTFCAVYRKLHNRYFDQLLHHLRTRFGVEMYERKEVLRGMLENRDRLTATAFVADQTPLPEHAQWVSFLNQDTPVFDGMARIARRFNYPVIYCATQRVRRGRYRIESTLICENPGQITAREIITDYMSLLESDIKLRPANWLWSHRRWKHKRPQV